MRLAQLPIGFLSGNLIFLAAESCALTLNIKKCQEGHIMMKRFTLLWLPLDIPSYNFDWQMSQGENSSRDEGMVPDSSSRSMLIQVVHSQSVPFPFEVRCCLVLFSFGLNYLRRAPRAPRFVESLAGNMIFKANIHGFLDHFWINILFWSFLNWSNMLILTSNFGLNHPTCWNRVWTAWNQLQFTSRALCIFLCNRRLKIDWKSFCVIFHG